MTIPEILKELEPYTGRFPMEAMRTAIEHREAMTPELLRVVEAIAANPAEVAKRDDYMLPVFATSAGFAAMASTTRSNSRVMARSEEHKSELQSRPHLAWP